MLTLHRPDSVFSLRHVPSWLMLCFAAGTVNAVTFLACGRFVTHVTGTVTRVGMEVVHLTLMLDFALVVASFIAGAMAAGLVLKGVALRGRRPPFSLPLWLTAGLIALVAGAGELGWLGSFGGSVDELGDFVHLCVLSFAMGLQNAAVATSTGQLVRTTHLTGPATDLGVHLADLLVARGEERALAKRHAALRAGKIVSYGLGAIAAVPACHALGYLSLLLPAGVIAAATVLSFVSSAAPAARRRAGEAAPPIGSASPPAC
jgi:uncharacterized membrane protein YoaK (UPF0700 family)